MRRSMLFMPGNNSGMLLNADALGADSVILDLEDAVSPQEKDSARILVRNALKYLGYKGCEVIIRINSIDTDFWKKDLDEILPMKPDMIMPPKVCSGMDIKVIENYMGEVERKHNIEKKTSLIPLIETALGVENAFEIASSSKRIKAIFLGGEDLTADLRCKRTKQGDEIFYSRGRMVMAARAAGIDVYDTPFTDVEDEEGLRTDAEFAKSLGFTGKACISPRHVQAVNEVFSPTLEEIEYAKEVMDIIQVAKEQGKGAISLRGKMIDAPIVERARQTLEAAKALGGAF
ncbi:HpcH/HpaI aldolase/citrate lyase family protein [Sedimentibacter saalensis]|uniref:Citrate lyase subunit beta/citryl-CoA lyase n=2 Tax=root TaxID=1 RepID=A0A562JCR1_9FIRM|nr:CoA ester lyase [Sedimentibacter saalensis]MEA5095245.1 CoA ester lyase [Sedimentibacter saalensis]TWH80735.1 citrate lyase subunit beta/citryl-CoA lyase [Sedimentibacter saalensis]